MLDQLPSQSIFQANQRLNSSTQTSIILDPSINDLNTNNFSTPVSASVLELDTQTPNPNWVKTIGGRGFDSGYGVAVDTVGNLYTIGEFRSSVNLDGNTTLTSSVNSGDVFVIKQNVIDGSIAWAKKIGGTSGDIGYGIAVDANGDVYTTGYFQGSADLNGDGTLEKSAGFADVFVIKQNGDDGSINWSKQIGGTGFDSGVAIAVDGSGNVYTTGTFNGSADLDGDGTPETSAGLSDAFVIKQNATDGSVTWARRIGATSSLSR